MKIIYEPKGRAGEYAELACNLAVGCTHACSYCYAPASMRMAKADFHKNVRIKKNCLEKLTDDAVDMAVNNDKRFVFFEFASDPFCTPEKTDITNRALRIMDKFGLNVTLLSKNPAGAKKALECIKNPQWRIGTTITSLYAPYEPNAPRPRERLNALREIASYGCYTWISFEPILYPFDVFSVMRKTKHFINEYKLGTLNHSKYKPAFNHTQFKITAENIAPNAKFYWKKEFLETIQKEKDNDKK